MPTGVYDASLITNRNRNRALSSFKNSLVTANASGNPVTPQQKGAPIASVNTEANMGCADGTCSSVAQYAGSNASVLPAYTQIIGSTPS
jgi:hypothetical protein